jgi:hypothetical protein
MYFPFPPPSLPAGTKQNGKLAERTFTEMENVNVVLPAPGTTSCVKTLIFTVLILTQF